MIEVYLRAPEGCGWNCEGLAPPPIRAARDPSQCISKPCMQGCHHVQYRLLIFVLGQYHDTGSSEEDPGVVSHL